jgi:hypothetical protein
LRRVNRLVTFLDFGELDRAVGNLETFLNIEQVGMQIMQTNFSSVIYECCGNGTDIELLLMTYDFGIRINDIIRFGNIGDLGDAPEIFQGKVPFFMIFPISAIIQVTEVRFLKTTHPVLSMPFENETKYSQTDFCIHHSC